MRVDNMRTLFQLASIWSTRHTRVVGEVFLHVVHSACSNAVKTNSIHFKYELKDLISTLLNVTEGSYMLKEKFDELLLSDGRVGGAGYAINRIE